MSDHRRKGPPLAWHRFPGAFANVGNGGGNTPTLAVAGYVCDCCGRQFVMIAAISETGEEVNVAVPATLALDVSDAISLEVLRMSPTAGDEIHKRQN